MSAEEIFLRTQRMKNMYAAIDSLTDKLDRQIKKHKEKLKDHHRGEGLKNNEAIQNDIS